MSRIACQVDAHETRWRGFLVDADCEASLETLREATGEKATEAKKHDDPDIVEEAWQDARTIVTSNRDDFLHHIAFFQNRPNKKDPPDLWGLLVNSEQSERKRKSITLAQGRLEDQRRTPALAGRCLPESLHSPHDGRENPYPAV
jgi:hypothetical protein